MVGGGWGMGDGGSWGNGVVILWMWLHRVRFESVRSGRLVGSWQLELLTSWGRDAGYFPAMKASS